MPEKMISRNDVAVKAATPGMDKRINHLDTLFQVVERDAASLRLLNPKVV
jgi:hypothetical protein